MVKQRAAVTTLLHEQNTILGRRRILQEAANVSRLSHQPMDCHPDRGLLSPWEPGCLACEREQELLSESGELWQRKRVLLEELADAFEIMHRRRIAGAARSRSGKGARMVERVAEYCATENLSPKTAKVAAIALGLKVSVSTVQRALRVINQSSVRSHSVPE